MTGPGPAVRDALRVGVREWRTVGMLLGANWLVAALMVAPVLPAVLATFGHAPLAVGEPLVSSEILGGLGTVFAGDRALSVLGPLVLLVLLQTFLAGGVVWRVCAGGPFHLGAFFGQSGRLVGRNARLFLWLLLLVLGLAVAFWRLSLEVGRVLLFRQDVQDTRRTAWRAFRLVLRSPLAVVLYALLGLLASLAVLLAVRFRASLPEGGAGLALLALAVGQGVLWLRLAFQVAGTRFAALLVERLDAISSTNGPAGPSPA